MEVNKDTDYNIEQFKKDMYILKVENAIQTGAVVLFFFFGIATLRDILKHVKK